MFQPEIKELIQISQLVEEGKIKEAFQIISELEQKNFFSPKEKLTCKLFKANLYSTLGKYLEAIETAKTVFKLPIKSI
ncbi:MAG: hypothetical protein R3255_06030 [Candidatus Lokiarchaeia archaeon]|nr:hypothetical protein [Candidatus Lokiarchaeia archaeon]